MVLIRPFVGREKELAEIRARFGQGARLITIVGTGGIGKTALARHAATELGIAHRFCDLSAARTADELLFLLAASFACEPADLATALEGRGELAILDNFEQLLPEGAATISDLIRDTKSARFLVTSREPLRLSFEERVEVPPLSEEEGARLFEERCASLSSHTLPEDRDAIIEIVRRLDGIPLAIELAAARAPLFRPAQILERLSDLGPASRDRPDRQATLQNAFDWSWSLLGDAERKVLSATALFRGGFTVEAAEAVIGRSIGSAPIVQILQSLREKSLLRGVDRAGVRRLAHFEVIRLFLEERLENADEMHRRYIDHHLAEVEALARDLSGPHGALAQQRFSAELENFLAAAHYASIDAPAIAARILLGVHELITLRGPFSGQLELVSSALEAAERANDPALIARACLSRAQVQVYRRRNAEAAHDIARAFESAIASGSEQLRGEAIRWRGIEARESGRDEEADRFLSEALSIAESTGDRLFVAKCLSNLGTLRRFQLRDDEALELYERALHLHRAIGNTQGEVVALANIAHLHAASGRLRAAVAAYREALEHRLDRVDLRTEAIVLAHLGGVEARLGEIDSAEAHEKKALETFVALSDGPMEALACAHLGAIASARRDFEAADAWFARSRRIAVPDPGWRVACDLLAALYDVARGETERARAALAGARSSMRPGSVYSEHVRQAVERVQSALESGVPGSPATKPSITIAADGTWFAVDAEQPVDLSRRGSLARLLRRLLEKRLASPDETVSIEELVEAGWAGEKMLPDAAKTRVYSAVRALRRFGLEQVLVTRDGGYLLHPAARVTRAP